MEGGEDFLHINAAGVCPVAYLQPLSLSKIITGLMCVLKSAYSIFYFLLAAFNFFFTACLKVHMNFNDN